MMETYSGKVIDPFNLKQKDVSLADTARSLAFTCRFNGHIDVYYSVANHCYLMAKWFYDRERYLEAKYALFHEGDEPIFGDIISPIKHHKKFKWLIPYLDKAQAKTFKKFGLDPVCPPSVKELDKRIVVAEAQVVKSRSNLAFRTDVDVSDLEITVFTPLMSEKKFLDIYEKIEKKLEIFAG